MKISMENLYVNIEAQRYVVLINSEGHYFVSIYKQKLKILAS